MREGEEGGGGGEGGKGGKGREGDKAAYLSGEVADAACRAWRGCFLSSFLNSSNSSKVGPWLLQPYSALRWVAAGACPLSSIPLMCLP